MFPFAYPSPVANSTFHYVSLLMDFDGADASTTFVDLSSAPHSLTAFGNAQLDTAQKYFGSASMLLDGTNDYCNCSANANLDTATNTTPWTIECFVRFASVAGAQAITGLWNTPVSGFMLYMSGGDLQFLNIGGTTVTYIGWGPVINTWYYVCVEFDGTKTRIYTDDGAGNAVMRASAVGIQQLFGTQLGGVAWAVGTDNANFTLRNFNGWIDEYRYTNGLAQYALDAGYPVPTAPFPTS